MPRSHQEVLNGVGYCGGCGRKVIPVPCSTVRKNRDKPYKNPNRLCCPTCHGPVMMKVQNK